MGVDTLITTIAIIFAKILGKIGFSVMAALICIFNMADIHLIAIGLVLY